MKFCAGTTFKPTDFTLYKRHIHPHSGLFTQVKQVNQNLLLIHVRILLHKH